MTPPSPTLTTASQQPVLLVFTSASQAKGGELDQLVEKVLFIVRPVVHSLCMSEALYPEVVRSFGFTSFPAFILLQKGQELWRYSGPADSNELILQLGNQLHQLPTR